MIKPTHVPRILAALLLSAALSPSLLADKNTKGVDAEIRENPDLGAVTATDSLRADSLRRADRSFINTSANFINLNGADWSRLREAIASCDTSVVTILHLGDSHIQAEGSTTPTRLLLQHRYGSGGRGLIIPFKLAGTNQPWDFSITSEAHFTGSRLLKKPWEGGMGFTGISIRPSSQKFNLRVSATEKEGIDTRFDHLRLHFRGNAPTIQSITDADTRANVAFDAVSTSPEVIDIYLQAPIAKADLHMADTAPDTTSRTTIHGIELLNSKGHGIVYSAIGNNGATYGTYNEVTGEARGIASVNPQLIIVSLGANESFGKISDEEFYREIDKLVTSLQEECPGAALLLTTPNETHKSYSKPVTTRRKGKRRRKTRKVKSYHVNFDSKRLRDVILRYGEENGIPTYDWYEVAGGDGSSHHWLRTSLMRNDRIHNSWDGYNLQGTLFYDALIKQLDIDPNK